VPQRATPPPPPHRIGRSAHTHTHIVGTRAGSIVAVFSGASSGIQVGRCVSARLGRARDSREFHSHELSGEKALRGSSKPLMQTTRQRAVVTRPNPLPRQEGGGQWNGSTIDWNGLDEAEVCACGRGPEFGLSDSQIHSCEFGRGCKSPGLRGWPVQKRPGLNRQSTGEDWGG